MISSPIGLWNFPCDTFIEKFLPCGGLETTLKYEKMVYIRGVTRGLF